MPLPGEGGPEFPDVNLGIVEGMSCGAAPPETAVVIRYGDSNIIGVDAVDTDGEKDDLGSSTGFPISEVVELNKLPDNCPLRPQFAEGALERGVVHLKKEEGGVSIGYRRQVTGKLAIGANAVEYMQSLVKSSDEFPVRQPMDAAEMRGVGCPSDCRKIVKTPELQAAESKQAAQAKANRLEAEAAELRQEA
jgi:hypothetical protein